MALRAMDLYDAYDKNMLPKEEGYIVSAFFNNDSPYSVIEVVSYAEVKSFHADKNSMTFQSDGKKIYILVEPSTYSQKSIEPYLRPSKYQIPMRFSDLNIHTCKNQYKIMYNKEAVNVLTSFTILKPFGGNYSFILFPVPEIKQSLSILFEKTFYKEANIPLADAKNVSEEIAELVVTKLCFPNKKKDGTPLETLNSKKLNATEAAETKKTAKKTTKTTSAKAAESKKTADKKTAKKTTKTTTSKKTVDEDKTIIDTSVKKTRSGRSKK